MNEYDVKRLIKESGVMFSGYQDVDFIGIIIKENGNDCMLYDEDSRYYCFCKPVYPIEVDVQLSSIELLDEGDVFLAMNKKSEGLIGVDQFFIVLGYNKLGNLNKDRITCENSLDAFDFHNHIIYKIVRHLNEL